MQSALPTYKKIPKEKRTRSIAEHPVELLNIVFSYIINEALTFLLRFAYFTHNWFDQDIYCSTIN